MTNCPRCDRPLIRNHDEASCLVHGLMVDPGRAHDSVEELGPQNQRPVAPNAGRPWSESDREFVLANKDRLAARDIGLLLGRTERGVHHWLSKSSLGKAPVASTQQSVEVPRDVNEELEDRARPGALPQLARSLGLSYSAARFRLYRRGVRLREADGMLSISEVARLYGTTRDRVRRLMRIGAIEYEPAGRMPRLDPASVTAAARLLRARSKHAPKARRR